MSYFLVFLAHFDFTLFTRSPCKRYALLFIDIGTFLDCITSNVLVQIASRTCGCRHMSITESFRILAAVRQKPIQLPKSSIKTFLGV